VQKINADVTRVLEIPDVRAILEQQGAEPARSTPEQFGAFIRAEIAKWEKVIKLARVERL